MRKFYDLSVKQKAIEMLLLGEKTLKEIAQELGIPEQTIATWKRKYKLCGDAFLSETRLRSPVRTGATNAVANLRRQMNISQVELAEMLGVAQSSIARYENGCFMPKIVKKELNRLLAAENLPLLP